MLAPNDGADGLRDVQDAADRTSVANMCLATLPGVQDRDRNLANAEVAAPA